MRVSISDVSQPQPHRAGFTLIELAIVLVLIGLLMGGVLVGKSVYHNTQIQSALDDASTYSIAIQQFRDKYGEMPGDFAGATNVWGFAGTTALPGCVSNSGITTVSDRGTCDGNGDGKYTFSSSEGYRAWQQLALAGFIKGNYTGAGAPPVFNVNCPILSSGYLGWSLAYADASDFSDGGTNYWGTQSIGNVLFLGAVTSDVTRGVGITPLEMIAVDGKLDDGLPGTGAILAEKTNLTCFDMTATPVAYNPANPNRICALRFMLDRFKSNRKY